MIPGPQKSESPAATGLIANERTENVASVPPAALIGNDRSLAQDKTLANLTAAFALHGLAVYELAAGGFVICDHCGSRHCPGLPELAAIARRMGVA